MRLDVRTTDSFHERAERWEPSQPIAESRDLLQISVRLPVLPPIGSFIMIDGKPHEVIEVCWDPVLDQVGVIVPWFKVRE